MSEKLTAAQREANLAAAARSTLVEMRWADYGARRRDVMFVASLLGHRMGVEQLREQPWGTVGECANCGQIAKTPRVGDMIDGRATFMLCPANR